MEVRPGRRHDAGVGAPGGGEELDQVPGDAERADSWLKKCLTFVLCNYCDERVVLEAVVTVPGCLTARAAPIFNLLGHARSNTYDDACAS